MRFVYLFISFLLVSMLSCNSPMDVNTTRVVKDQYGKVNIYPKIIEMSFEQNGIHKEFLAVGSRVEVDTNLEVPAIWFHLDLKSPPDKDINYDRINIDLLNLSIDSMPVNSNPFKLGEMNTLYKAWTKFTLTRGLSTKFDTAMLSDPVKNTSEISFSLNKAKKEIWSYLYSKIYNERLWFTYRDSLAHDTVIVTYYDTTYRDGNMEVTPRTRRDVQERNVRVEEIQRAKDTLFLRGKIRLQY